MSDALTHLPGKDAPLERSIARLTGTLTALGFHVAPVSWRNPVPHVWSVHLRDRHCAQLFSNGKGRSRAAALASALGEFCERLATNYFFADFHLPGLAERPFAHYPDERWLAPDDPRLLADAPLRAAWDRDGLLAEADLRDLTSGGGRGICCLPFRRADDGREVLVPVNVLENLLASNGMAAGNTLPEARVQALSEIFERAVRARVLREGLCLPDIPEPVVDRFPAVRAAVDAIRAAGFTLWLRDASLGGRYPVVNVTLLNAEDGSCYASWGAHPLFEVALERTVTELLQGRALDQMRGFATPSLDRDEVASLENLETHFIDASGLIHWPFFGSRPDFPFTAWDGPADTAAQFRHLQGILARDGLPLYLRDYRVGDVPACRLLVPGLSEIYPPDDLLEANNNVALPVLDALHALPDPDDGQLRRLAQWLNGLDLDDMAPVHELAGLRPDPDSCWAHLRLGELRVWTALALGDHAAAADQLAWLRELDALPAARRRLLAALHDRLQLTRHGLDPADFAPALAGLYGSEAAARAQALQAGHAAWPDLTPALTGAAHRELQAAYELIWHWRAGKGPPPAGAG